MRSLGTEPEPEGTEATLEGQPRKLDSMPAPVAATRVGRYVLIEVVGRGAMGEVWTAFDPDLDRKVAIKLLPNEHVATDASRTRTIREARAMARLADPHVVAIHDVGLAEDTVFIAMEYVSGGTLRGWLKEDHDAREIMQMFCEAGRGLVAAHEHGLVHRDFKPDNVLVGADGRPRVADFGLVRTAALTDDEPAPTSAPASTALGAGVDTSASLTATGAIMGTPAFMSPEQWAGQTPTAASDQFSFCVALWRALAGQAPFAGRPPTLVSNVLNGIATPWPAGRPVQPRVLRALLQGLAQDPEARHASMSALLVALQGPPRRAWLWPAAGVAGLSAVAVAVIAMGQPDESFQAICDGGREALAGVWDVKRAAQLRTAILGSGIGGAETAAQRAAAGLQSYADTWIDAHRDACRATRVFAQQSESVMEQRMACLGRRRRLLGTFVDSLAVASRQKMPNTIDGVARLPALQPCSALDELSRQTPLPTDPDARAAIDQAQAAIDGAVALHLAGRPADAQARLASVPYDAETLEHLPTRAEFLVTRSKAWGAMGKTNEQRLVLEPALLAARECGSIRWAAEVELQFASVDYAESKLVSGTSWVRLAEADANYLGDPDLLQSVARARTRLLHRAGDYAKALDTNTQERELALQAGKGEYTLAGIDEQRANLLVRLGRVDDGLALLNKVVAVKRRVLWSGHPAIATALNNRAVALQNTDRPHEAITDLREALLIRRAALGLDHPDVTDAMVNLGNALRDADQLDEALETMAAAMKFRETQVSADHPQLAITHNDYAVTLDTAGRTEEALEHYEAARIGFERAFGSDSHMVAYALSGLADIALRQGQAGRAAELDERALRLRQAIYNDDHPLVVESLAAVQRDRDAQ